MCKGHIQRTDTLDCHRDCRVCLLQDFEIMTRQQALEDEFKVFYGASWNEILKPREKIIW